MNSPITTVFVIKNLSDYDHYKNWPQISDNPEDWELCVARERFIEIASRAEPVFFVLGDMSFYKRVVDFEKLTTQDIGRLSRSRLLLRGGAKQVHQAKKFLETGFKLLVSRYESKAIEHWFEFVPEIGRKIITLPAVTASEKIEMLWDDYSDNQGRLHVKSVHWSYSGSYDGFIESTMVMMLEYGGEGNPIMFSEFLDLAEDEEGTIEYRCFVIDGLLHSISRYFDYDKGEQYSPPQEAVEYAQKIVAGVAGKSLPGTFVLDIGLLKNGEYAIIEFNPLFSSGRYYKNNPNFSLPLHVTTMKESTK